MKERIDFQPAYLPSEGLNGRRATLHVFDHTGAITLRTAGNKPVKVLGHYYRCTETGSVRLWGYEADAPMPGDN